MLNVFQLIMELNVAVLPIMLEILTSNVQHFKVVDQTVNVTHLKLVSTDNAVHHVNAVHLPIVMLLITEQFVNVHQVTMEIQHKDVLHQQIHVIQILVVLTLYVNLIEEIQFVSALKV